MVPIRTIQERLVVLGFDPGPVDGIRGPRTNAAITAFKVSKGLRARPYIGPITLAAMFPQQAAMPETMPPPWFQIAESRLGTEEIPGPGSNPAILDWADDLDLHYPDDDIPWCGLFVAACLADGLKDKAGEMPANPLGARNWLDYGVECGPVLGALLVFWRGARQGWQGHVGFYAGEDVAAYHVLGGNQGNRVSIMRIAKTRLLGARWPGAYPLNTNPVMVGATGALSENEA